MIQFRCTKCREGMEAPSSLAGQKIACPVCGTERKVPLPRPATDRQKEYSRNVGFVFSDDITYDEISAKLDNYETMKYFVHQVWFEMTGTKIKDCRLEPAQIDAMIQKILNHAKLSAVILPFCEEQEMAAMMLSSQAADEYYAKRKDTDDQENIPPFPEVPADFKCPARQCPAFSQVEAIIDLDWADYKPKSSWLGKLFGKP